MVTDYAMTRKKVKDTPAQSQVERDKTVATNEDGSYEIEWWNSNEAKCIAGKCVPGFRGCRGQISKKVRND